MIPDNEAYKAAALLGTFCKEHKENGGCKGCPLYLPVDPSINCCLSTPATWWVKMFAKNGGSDNG